MKKSITTLLIFIFLFNMLHAAPQPEPVYGLARIIQPLSWYKTQLQLWMEETRKNPGNAQAWYYAYKASRNIMKLDSATPARQEAHQQLLQSMEKAVPESYEYHLVMWSQSGQNENYLSHLKKAEILANGRTEHLPFAVLRAEIERNTAKRDSASLSILRSGDYSPGYMYYMYNTLAGLKPNAILLTAGDNDTYPAWYLQARGIRRDVLVINTSMLQIPAYGNAIRKELGLPETAVTNKSYPVGSDTQSLAQAETEKNLLPMLYANTRKRPLYLSLTVDGPNIRAHAGQLYLCGLAYEYSQLPVDQSAELRANFENRYMLDYLFQPLYHDISQQGVTRCNANYIVPMLELYGHYNRSGESQKAGLLKNKILLLSAGRPEENEIKQTLNQP
ncbi:MAG: hypothetical protein JNL57_02885 [Bacteroidetes bacterium]|nr:hypothetical protein [Bacteroidota bacterium]